VSTLSSIGAASSIAFKQADSTLQRAASTMARVGSSSSPDPTSGAVDLTKARVDEQLGVRVANTEGKMQKALLDMFA
jgi:hypothetical protein